MLKNRSSPVFCGVTGRNFLVTYDNRVVSYNRIIESGSEKALFYILDNGAEELLI